MKAVDGASDGCWASVQDVGVGHRRLHVPVSEKLLDGAGVVPVLEEVRGERVAEGVWHVMRFVSLVARPAAVTARWRPDSWR